MSEHPHWDERADKSNCPPEVSVTLKWKKNEWQDRAKVFNKEAFNTHKEALETIKTQSLRKLEQWTLTSDQRSMLQYMQMISAEKPQQIAILQAMLKDACGKAIAIDGRIWTQTVAAMKEVLQSMGIWWVEAEAPPTPQAWAPAWAATPEASPPVSTVSIPWGPEYPRERQRVLQANTELLKEKGYTIGQAIPALNLWWVVGTITNGTLAVSDKLGYVNIEYVNIKSNRETISYPINELPAQWAPQKESVVAETQEHINTTWYQWFDAAKSYASTQWYELKFEPTGAVVKSLALRNNINKIENQRILIRKISPTPQADWVSIGEILPATSNLGPIKQSDVITRELKAQIDTHIASN